MKTRVFRLIFLLSVIAPMTSVSQTNIKAAFDAIIKCPEAEITESHFLKNDKETNMKSGQDDIYLFDLPADRMNLIKNVLEAFEKDKASAYVVKKGKNRGGKINEQLYSEQSTANVIYVQSVDDSGTDYIYELFVPSKSEDPDGTHRYAYAFNYKEKDGKIEGKIIINYATTDEYRDRRNAEIQRARDLEWRINLNKASEQSAEVDTKQSWLDQVMACLNGLEDANKKTRIALATKTYQLVNNVKDYPKVTSKEKDTILKIIRLLRKDPIYSDPILNELLLECEQGLI